MRAYSLFFCVALAACSNATVSTVSGPPVAVAPPDQSVAPGSTVILDGSASHDPAGKALTYQWTQTAGPSVTLSDASKAIVTFTAQNETQITDLVFQLTVSNGQLSSAESTTVTINPALATTSGSSGTASSSTTTTSSSSGTTGTSSSSSSSSGTTGSSSSSGTTGTSSSSSSSSSGGSTTGSTTPANITKVVSLHAVTRTGITVFFMTDVSVQARVDYAPVGGGAGGSATESSATTRHVIDVTGLTANTQYSYTVHAGTASATGSFWTAVDYQASPQSFTFAVAGDARGLTEWHTIANAILAKNPRFMVQTGDNDGNWSNSDQAWRDYYSSGQALFAKVPVFAAQGNHDAVPDYSTFNVAPQSSSNSDTYYAFVYGNAGFVAVNGNSTTSTQTNWVSNALSKLSGGPLFVFQHQPLYSCGGHGSSSSMQSTYQSLFENNFVTSNYTGHDHDLIYWSTINGVRYVVSGGAGTTLYGLSGCSGPYASSQFGFMMVTINGSSVKQEFFDDQGNSLYADTFTAHGQSLNFSNLSGLVVY